MAATDIPRFVICPKSGVFCVYKQIYYTQTARCLFDKSHPLGRSIDGILSRLPTAYDRTCSALRY